jgi:hypothetical protein
MIQRIVNSDSMVEEVDYFRRRIDGGSNFA